MPITDLDNVSFEPDEVVDDADDAGGEVIFCGVLELLLLLLLAGEFAFFHRVYEGVFGGAECQGFQNDILFFSFLFFSLIPFYPNSITLLCAPRQQLQTDTR
jgi:hypothetical protein